MKLEEALAILDRNRKTKDSFLVFDKDTCHKFNDVYDPIIEAAKNYLVLLENGEMIYNAVASKTQECYYWNQNDRGVRFEELEHKLKEIGLVD